LEQLKWVVSGVLLVALAGCGGGTDGASPASGGAAAGASGAATAGVSAGGAGGSSTAGASSGGAAGTSPNANGACTAPFGPTAPVVVEEDPLVSINGVSVTADELELYYSRRQAPDSPHVVVRRTRASKSETFGPVEYLPMLDGSCGENPRVNPDISEDGLTLYITCTKQVDDTGVSEGMSPLRVARRASRSAAFALDAEPIGSVFASAGLSADELTAYTDGEVFDTAPQMFERASKTETFMGPRPVPGLSTPFRSPDVSSNRLVLFGAATDPVDARLHVYRATRASVDAPFGAPERLELGLHQTANVAVGAPNITPSCSLYMIAVIPAIGSTVQVARPQ
jgi:hypothetical protein